jgi:hypothetical protein
MNLVAKFDHLRRELAWPAAPAQPAAIDRAEKALGGQLPSDYRAFLLEHNGGEGAIAQLMPVEQLALAEEAYPELDHLAGWVVFGSDGGGEAFVFNEAGEVLLVPWIGSREDAIPQGSFTEFTQRLVKGELFEREDGSGISKRGADSAD